MEPKAFTLQVGKFYRSRDGRIWEVVEKVPEGYSKENSDSDYLNVIYCFWAICYTTKTFNTLTDGGRTFCSGVGIKEDLVEECNDVLVTCRLKYKFVRYDGRLFCVDQSDNICTYLYEEMPKEIVHQHGNKISGVVLEHFTYEDYCKFYGIEPVYTKKLPFTIQFSTNFVPS